MRIAYTKSGWCLFWLLGALTGWASAAEPVATAWLRSSLPAPAAGKLAQAQPEVHAVTVTAQQVEIRSAGVSLYYLGPLQTPPVPAERQQAWRFQVPRFPSPACGEHGSVRPDILGVFVNGVPVFNQFSGASYQNQNLWHFDPVAAGDDGTFVAGGQPRADRVHGTNLGLLADLIADGSRHSPLLGFALDGYPIYGPWTYTKADGTGGLRRMRSSYRLRDLKTRTQWPQWLGAGAKLTPGQYGPPVNAEFPLGSFVEDYEYVAGAGDLDEFNGRLVKTPEFPQGTYAYFLTTDERGRLAFPYLLTGRYFGEVQPDALRRAVTDLANDAAAFEFPLGQKTTVQLLNNQPEFSAQAEAVAFTAGQPVRLSFMPHTTAGTPLRFLEYVHERPLHLLVISDDLAEFAHIHPELVAGDRYEIVHTFARGGRYWLYADFALPGAAPRVERMALQVSGVPGAKNALQVDALLTKQQAGLEMRLTPQGEVRTGAEVEFSFTVRDLATGQTPAKLEPYLGAWGHFVVLDQSKTHFIHAHPRTANEPSTANTEMMAHTHAALEAGPPPDELRTRVSFPQPGLYKIWAQFQRAGEIITQPFVIQVSAGGPLQVQRALAIPADALRVTLNAQGFAPALLKLPANRPIKLAITRSAEPNCGDRIVFPALGLTRKLALGETILLELPAQPAGELKFSCGMGMYRGLVVVE